MKIQVEKLQVEIEWDESQIPFEKFKEMILDYFHPLKTTVRKLLGQPTQEQVNRKYLLEAIDCIHADLCPEQTGTWQMRVAQAIAAAKKKGRELPGQPERMRETLALCEAYISCRNLEDKADALLITIRKVLDKQPEQRQEERSCENCKRKNKLLACKFKPSFIENCPYWQTIPPDTKKQAKREVEAIDKPMEGWVKLDDNILTKLLTDCAECLDDCLIRIYPDEFEKKYIDAACHRFSEHHGTIARIATLVDRINKYKSRHGQGKG